MKLQALVFDVDGTLADTEETHRQAFNHAFVRFGLGWDWTPARYRQLLAISGGHERIVHFIERLPLADSEKLLERSVDTGQIAINDYLVARQEILNGRREHLERQLQLAKAAATARFVAGVAP